MPPLPDMLRIRLTIRYQFARMHCSWQLFDKAPAAGFSPPPHQGERSRKQESRGNAELQRSGKESGIRQETCGRGFGVKAPRKMRPTRGIPLQGEEGNGSVFQDQGTE